MTTVPRDRFHALAGPSAAHPLDDEGARVAYVAGRLVEAMSRPLVPGSAHVAEVFLQNFGRDHSSSLAEKVLETLRDGHRHDRTILVPGPPVLALHFVAWNGTHREVQAERYGDYIVPMLKLGAFLVEKLGPQVAALLEIDAFVRDEPDPDDPGRGLDEVFEVDVEFAYLPGWAFGGTVSDRLPKGAVINGDVCTPEERLALGG